MYLLSQDQLKCSICFPGSFRIHQIEHLGSWRPVGLSSSRPQMSAALCSLSALSSSKDNMRHVWSPPDHFFTYSTHRD